MSAGDDSGALSRTSGFLEGLLGAQNKDMARADEERAAARTALQKMRGRVPGQQMAALVPAWNPANDAPEEALSPAVAGYMATQRGAARNRSAEQIAQANRAMSKAIADMKANPGATGTNANKWAVHYAQQALKSAGLTVEDPEGAELYQQTYGLLSPDGYQQLFEEVPRDPSAWFPGAPKMKWRDPNFESRFQTPAAPAATKSVAKPKTVPPPTKPNSLSGY